MIIIFITFLNIYFNNTFIPAINSNFLINYCIFENCININNGGGLYISNIKFNISIFNSLFLNCSANESGGGILIICFNFLMENTCFIECNTRNFKGWYWGHAGYVNSSNSIISLIGIFKCPLNNNYKGHNAFALDYGIQKTSYLNLTECIPNNFYSGYFFSRTSDALCKFSSFSKNFGYDSLLFARNSGSIITENCNFIYNNVSFGSIYLYDYQVIVKNSIFKSNTKDLYTNFLIICFNCITDSSSFTFGSTTLNCLINQKDIVLISHNSFLIQDCFYPKISKNLYYFKRYFILLNLFLN